MFRVLQLTQGLKQRQQAAKGAAGLSFSEVGAPGLQKPKQTTREVWFVSSHIRAVLVRALPGEEKVSLQSDWSQWAVIIITLNGPICP